MIDSGTELDDAVAESKLQRNLISQAQWFRFSLSCFTFWLGGKPCQQSFYCCKVFRLKKGSYIDLVEILLDSRMNVPDPAPVEFLLPSVKLTSPFSGRLSSCGFKINYRFSNRRETIQAESYTVTNLYQFKSPPLSPNLKKFHCSIHSC